ncbi:MAG TPA: hypothetical protein VNH18_32615 [Bryobacteraceae bacterium]|nr:hypothetical protein [Bryobacteraceae bacterium]
MAAEPSEIIAPAGFEDGTAFQPEPTPEPEPESVPAVPDPDPAAPVDPTAPVVAAPEPPTRFVDPNDLIRQIDGIRNDLKQERIDRQAAQQEAARLKGQLEGIQLEQRRGPQAPTPLSADVAAKATAWAHRWGLYTPEGQPDVQAAANALDELRKDFSGEVDARVNARVQPVVQVLQHAHAQTRIDQIVKIGQEHGADPAMLRTFSENLAAVQPEALNDQNVIVGLIGLARGMGALATPAAPAAPVTPAVPTVAPTPNITERPGGRITVAPALSGIERQIATKRGMSNEKWQTVSKDFEKMDHTRGLVVEKD